MARVDGDRRRGGAWVWEVERGCEARTTGGLRGTSVGKVKERT
jgi:hypothetical protein